MFLLRCPKCKQTMRYNPGKGGLSDKSKKCVYCGHSFRVRGRIAKKVG